MAPAASDPPTPTAPNASLSDVRKVVSENAEHYIDRLAEAVAIPSVSTNLDMRDHCHKMAERMHEWIQELDGTSEKVMIGFQELEDGTRFNLPPVILATFGRLDRTKPTVMVYGHYDVQPASKADGWSTEPFVLTEIDDKLYGRGATDDKGPILAWLWAVDVYRRLDRTLPVNLKLCLEGMEESRSECLSDLLQREARRGGFLADVDYIVVTDNYCLSGSKPCLTYGLRGLASFELDVFAGTQTLHSGVYGGCIAEPMTDLVQLLASVSASGHDDIAVPDCGRSSAEPLTEQEEALYRGITFDLGEFQKEAGGVSALMGGGSVKEVLMNRWRYPSLSIHGIEPYTGPGLKTVIPGAVSGKFSIRLVPGQDPEKVENSVRATLEARFKELKSPNRLTITSSSSRAWLTNPKGTLFQAGASALLKVHGVRPDLTREGGTIPVVGMLQEAIEAEIMLLPLGSSDDGAHSENEKMGKAQYLNGIPVLCTLLEEIATAHARRDDVPKSRGALSRIRDIWYGLS